MAFLDPSLDQLIGVVAALEAVRPVSARPEFVADLRARLMADTTANKGRGAARRAVSEWSGVSAAWASTRGQSWPATL